MHPIDYKLLSLLKQGETMRIVLSRPAGESLFSFALETQGVLGKPSKELTQRMSIVLGALKRQGYDYSCRVHRPHPEYHRYTWLQVIPRTRDLAASADGRLGFGLSKTTGSTTSVTIRTPALGAVQPPNLVAFATEFIEQVPQIEVVELAFTRHVLEDKWEKVLASSLSLGFNELMGVIDRKDYSAALQQFLSLWLVRKFGWQIGIRAGITRGRAVPRAALELLGREIYDTECDIRTTVRGGKGKAPEMDLSMAYPDGWKFPRLLPPKQLRQRLNLATTHNTYLPALPRHGMHIGEIDGDPVRLSADVRDRHTYIVGATGTGKSTLLTRMIRHDMEKGEAVVLLDPHGDLFRDVVKLVPKSRAGDVLVVDPNDPADPVGFNIFDVPRDAIHERRVDFVVNEFVSFFQSIWENPEAFGPMFELYFRNTIMLMMCQSGPSPSLVQFERIMTNTTLRQKLYGTCTNPMVVEFWRKNAEQVGGEAALANIVPYITSKVSPLIQASFLGRMLGHERNLLALDERLDAGGIVLVNLNKGMLGARGSSLLGSLLTSQIFAAGLKRSLQSKGTRKPVSVYIDEFQNVVSENIAAMFSEARKFGLRMHVANQHLGQLNGNRGRQSVVDAILGNVGNMIFFRLGVPDADRLEKFCEPFTRKQMQELPNYHALVRLLTSDGPIAPVVMKTLPS